MLIERHKKFLMNAPSVNVAVQHLHSAQFGKQNQMRLQGHVPYVRSQIYADLMIGAGLLKPPPGPDPLEGFGENRT